MQLINDCEMSISIKFLLVLLNGRLEWKIGRRMTILGHLWRGDEGSLYISCAICLGQELVTSSPSFKELTRITPTTPARLVFFAEVPSSGSYQLLPLSNSVLNPTSFSFYWPS